MVIWSQIHGGVSLWRDGMFAPEIAEENRRRSEAEFRDLMRQAAEDTVAYLTGRQVRSVR